MWCLGGRDEAEGWPSPKKQLLYLVYSKQRRNCKASALRKMGAMGAKQVESKVIPAVIVIL